ncbi:helix-turn-helix domain-containing protein [Bosea sp. NPDC003192]|uniref:helix-turn-helix domain-containing protein n=1 Tax=Bosea sp. NPDC003192 TaxID=3390551 RepID=UPI003D071A72
MGSIRIFLVNVFHTVEQVAERLKLHPKTVLRFIREGRLRATRVGKSYRIVASDLDAFAGVDGAAPAAKRAVRVTSVLEVSDLDLEGAQKIATFLSAAIMSTEARPNPIQLTTAFDNAARLLKVVVIGTPADTSQLLQLVQFQLENLR